LPRWLLAIGWTLASLALAAPAWEQLHNRCIKIARAGICFGAQPPGMLAQDAKPSSYERAHYKLGDMLKRAPMRNWHYRLRWRRFRRRAC